MKIFRTILLLLTICGVIFFSCQMPISPYTESPQQAQGFLLSGDNDSCAIEVFGEYDRGFSLNDSNYIEVQVNVTSPGNYSISTDTVNGFYFSATGSFSAAGNFTLKLKATGMPQLAQMNTFKISFNNSSCFFSLFVHNSTSSASFNFDGAPGICNNDSVYGTFVKGLPIDTNAKVQIHVFVTIPGIYSISTNTVDGYSFSGSGLFTNTGLQPVVLTACGTPKEAGTDVFFVSSNQSSCTFSVDVLTTVTVSGSDYFPLTLNSYWTYDDLVHKGDTLKRTIFDTMTAAGNLYKKMREELRFGGPYEYLYRKDTTTYLELAAPNKYTTFFQYKEPVNADIPFLREGLTAGIVWQTPEYIDTASDGSIIFLRYNLKCLNANTTITLGNHAFENVYEISLQPLVKITSGDYNFTGESYLFYYAKGVGLIYLQKKLAGFVQTEWQIRNWQVY